MTITKDHVVEIDYKLTNDDGQVLDTSEGAAPLAYLHGHNNIVMGLEKELEGKKEGDNFQAKVNPSEGYGDRVEQLVSQVPKDEFSTIPDLQEGMQLQAQTEQGFQIFTVVKIDGDTVTVDGNHPLAGQTLHFEVTVKSVRAASDEEIAHGHVHGPGGAEH